MAIFGINFPPLHLRYGDNCWNEGEGGAQAVTCELGWHPWHCRAGGWAWGSHTHGLPLVPLSWAALIQTRHNLMWLLHAELTQQLPSTAIPGSTLMKMDSTSSLPLHTSFLMQHYFSPIWQDKPCEQLKTFPWPCLDDECFPNVRS